MSIEASPAHRARVRARAAKREAAEHTPKLPPQSIDSLRRGQPTATVRPSAPPMQAQVRQPARTLPPVPPAPRNPLNTRDTVFLLIESYEKAETALVDEARGELAEEEKQILKASGTSLEPQTDGTVWTEVLLEEFDTIKGIFHPHDGWRWLIGQSEYAHMGGALRQAKRLKGI